MSEDAKRAIVAQANECESALRCADFCERNLSCADNGFRKLAAYHSDRAFEWARASV